MKVMCILGTRPEIIRLSIVMEQLAGLCEFTVVDTGQNYVPSLKDIFYRELKLNTPSYILDSRADTAMEQIGRILSECDRLMRQERPDRVLILGDTNSALSALTAKRLGIPVFHMEAGNRCYDDRVPEEVNRRVIDHCSDVLMPYTERSRANLLREGIAGHRIYVTGNPILEVLKHYEADIESSAALRTMQVQEQKYFLVTLHRAENVDIPERLQSFVRALADLQQSYGVPVICSVHPRTASQLERFNININKQGFRLSEPLGLFDFVQLEKKAMCVLSDSGTVQEECCIFRVPNVTLRDVTERPETVESGSNIIAGCESGDILTAVKAVLRQGVDWTPPPEYLTANVSRTVVKIVLGRIPAR